MVSGEQGDGISTIKKKKVMEVKTPRTGRWDSEPQEQGDRSKNLEKNATQFRTLTAGSQIH